MTALAPGSCHVVVNLLGPLLTFGMVSTAHDSGFADCATWGTVPSVGLLVTLQTQSAEQTGIRYLCRVYYPLGSLIQTLSVLFRNVGFGF